jgi:hypothetical protein
MASKWDKPRQCSTRSFFLIYSRKTIFESFFAMPSQNFKEKKRYF